MQTDTEGAPYDRYRVRAAPLCAGTPAAPLWLGKLGRERQHQRIMNPLTPAALPPLRHEWPFLLSGLPQALVEQLPAGRLPGASQLTVLEGAVWVTWPGCGEDFFLRAGQTLALPARLGGVLIEAEPRLDPRPARVLWSASGSASAAAHRQIGLTSGGAAKRENGPEPAQRTVLASWPNSTFLACSSTVGAWLTSLARW